MTSISPQEFDVLLPLVCTWTEEQEQLIREQGVGLTDAQMVMPDVSGSLPQSTSAFCRSRASHYPNTQGCALRRRRVGFVLLIPPV